MVQSKRLGRGLRKNLSSAFVRLESNWLGVFSQTNACFLCFFDFSPFLHPTNWLMPAGCLALRAVVAVGVSFHNGSF